MKLFGTKNNTENMDIINMKNDIKNIKDSILETSNISTKLDMILSNNKIFTIEIDGLKKKYKKLDIQYNNINTEVSQLKINNKKSKDIIYDLRKKLTKYDDNSKKYNLAMKEISLMKQEISLMMREIKLTLNTTIKENNIIQNEYTELKEPINLTIDIPLIDYTSDNAYFIIELIWEKEFDQVIDFINNNINIKKYFSVFDGNNNTCVHLLCSFNRFDIIYMLIDKGIIQIHDLFHTNSNNCSEIYILCEKAPITLIMKLDIKIEYFIKLNFENNTPLHILCSTEKSEIIKELVKNGDANINHFILQSINGVTPLHFLCYHNENDIIHLLFKNKKMDITYFQNKGKTFTELFILCKQNNTQLINRINNDSNIKKEHYLNKHFSGTEIYQLCRNNGKNIVDIITKCDIGIADLHNECLYWICRNNYDDILMKICNNNIDKKYFLYQDKYKKTGIFWLCKNKMKNILTLLIKTNVNLKQYFIVKDIYGRTALSWLCTNKMNNILKLLIKKEKLIKNDFQNENKKKITEYTLLKKYKLISIIQMLNIN